MSDRSGYPARALLFDLDGLLVDSETVWARAERAIMVARSSSWTDEDAIACRGTGIPETARRMAERSGRPFDPARDPEELVDMFLSLAPTIVLQPGARELVVEAREIGARLAVASSSPRRVVSTVLGAVGIGAAFDDVITGDDVERKKPAPDIFHLAAERLGAAPGACVVFEDSFPGVLAGKAAGMFVVAVPEVDRGRFEGVADAVVASLFEARRCIALTPFEG